MEWGVEAVTVAVVCMYSSRRRGRNEIGVGSIYKLSLCMKEVDSRPGDDTRSIWLIDWTSGLAQSGARTRCTGLTVATCRPQVRPGIATLVPAPTVTVAGTVRFLSGASVESGV